MNVIFISFVHDQDDVTLMATNFSKQNKKPQKEADGEIKSRIQPSNFSAAKDNTKFAEAHEILNDDVDDEIEVYN